MGEELVLAHSGAIVNLDEADDVARALREVQDIQGKLAEAARVLKSAIAYHASQQGTKTLYIDGVGKLELKNDTQVDWDIEGLERRLRRAGCPEDVIGEIIIETVSRKVDARRAKQAASANPNYARAVELSRTESPKTPTVSFA